MANRFDKVVGRAARGAVILVLAGCSAERATPAAKSEAPHDAPPDASPDAPPTAPSTASPAGVLSVRRIQSPAGKSTVFPRLCRGGDATVYLSFTQRAKGGEHRLEFARFAEGEFDAPRLVASGKNWFVNWADFPSVTASADGTLAAHWLQRNGEGTYSYGIRIACSTDGGATWPNSFWLHEDRQEVEHGFATLVPDGDHFRAVWLDGRDMPKRRAMTLRTGSFKASGPIPGETLLDDQVCECCATDAAIVDSQLIAVYRDRTAANVRDISVVTGKGKAWTLPCPIHVDDWSNPG